MNKKCWLIYFISLICILCMLYYGLILNDLIGTLICMISGYNLAILILIGCMESGISDKISRWLNE